MTVESGALTSGSPDRFVSQAAKLGYTGPFDGLRGAALLMVLIAHASYFNFASFAVAVDSFFVISGFLIITLILEEDRSTGGLSFRNFYIRRALRLFPVLYLVLLLTLLGALVVGNKTDPADRKLPGIHPQGLVDKTVNDVASAGLYVYHVVHPVNSELVAGKAPAVPDGSSLGAPVHRPLIQVWSLSVEEHFYLIAAAMTVLVIRRNKAKQLVGLFLGLWAFVGIARALGHVGYREMWYQRPDALLLGVALAFVHAMTPAEWSERANRRLVRAGHVACAVLVADVFVGTVFAKKLGVFVAFLPGEGKFLQDGLYWGRFGFTIASAALAVMVWSVVRVRDQPLARLLSIGWLRALGRRSYVVYIVHVPLAVLIDIGLEGHISEGARLLLYLPLLVIGSEVLHRYVEQPALKLKHRFTRADASGVPVRER
jgi:peptidoglycan/LPS O-acetylase OafA/YrhL